MSRSATKAGLAAWSPTPPVVAPRRQYADVRWTALPPARPGISPDLAVGIALALAWPIAVALAFLG